MSEAVDSVDMMNEDCVRSGEGFRETKVVANEKGKEAKASSKNLAWRNPAIG
jgi:hypothetical protein